MAFPPAFLDELRFRVRLTDVVGRKVKLTRAGREWKGCCPFHNEKTPSFYINEDKGFYHCFGCGAHGDVIRYLTDGEGMGFLEAVQSLAAQAGLEVPRETPEDREKAERVKGLHDIMEMATLWFAENLNGMSGSAARAYFERRGLSRATIEKFRLGFAPDNRTALRTALIAKGATEQQLVDAGLLIQVEDKQPYDRFRGRVMFPIRDPKGRVIAFGGRVLDGGEPKYLNSPDTPLFDKGRTLFNFDIAAPVSRKSAEIFVVEGYMDVIALAQAGIDNAVAPLGTALTEDQIKYVWRVAPEPLLCFDGDGAGQKAALRAAMRTLPLLEPGKSLRFITLPEKEDPDSLVRAKGRAAFEALKGDARSLIDIVYLSEVAGTDLSTPERRALVQSRLIEQARTVQHQTVKSLYETEFRQRLDKLFGRGPRQAGQRGLPQRGYAGQSIPPSASAISAARKLGSGRNQEPLIRSLLLTAVRHPHVLDSHIDLFAHLPLEAGDLEGFRDSLIEVATRQAEALDSGTMRTTLAAAGYGSLLDSLESQDQLKLRFSSFSADLSAATRGFVLVGAWLTQLAAIESDFDSVRQQAAESLDEQVLERQSYLRAERDRIREEMIAYVRAESVHANQN
jgi:DNA primase